ncbi:MAG: alpha-1,4-glucan--maltose-1-phosphate maltosyltransferase [Actinomycetes bacterium]
MGRTPARKTPASKPTASTPTARKAPTPAPPAASPPPSAAVPLAPRTSTLAWQPSLLPPPPELVGRFPITEVSPVSVGGRRPATAAAGEAVPVRATAFREGHDAMGVTAILTRPDGSVAETVRLRDEGTGLDTWSGHVRPDTLGDWTFTLEAWGSPWDTWLHRTGIKIPAGIDVELELLEGSLLLEKAGADLPSGLTEVKAVLSTAASTLVATALPVPVRAAASTDPAVARIMHEYPIRDGVTASGPWPLRVQRREALVGSWYEFFPRSEGATLDPPKSGSFATALPRLDAVADMGFDVVYLPPIHPIGRVNRKGANNTLTPGPDDPGVPWAIGSSEGGHDAVHPALGTLADFDSFVARTQELGMEIALDLALQAAPDHPWVAAHPEWFTTRADGTIAYAENPPKKYQDIYPLNFDNDPEGLYAEVERVVRFWMAHGVRIFRVDNPHTKPLWVWDRLMSSVFATDPDVLFLAEAFTRPAMMRALAEVGFQQSYTYFTWRNTRTELEEYGRELAGPSASYMRPNFFVNTPDINPEFLQHSGPAGFAIRATLAATMSPTYGVYSGFELFEHIALRPGSEEYLDSEKYQYRPRDWELARKQARTLAPYLTQLNRIRHAHPALQDLRSLHFHASDNQDVIAYSKRDGEDVVLVVCTLDPGREREATVYWELAAIGIDDSERFIAHDLIADETWTWGRATYVRLRPWEHVAHIVHARKI